MKLDYDSPTNSRINRPKWSSKRKCSIPTVPFFTILSIPQWISMHLYPAPTRRRSHEPHGEALREVEPCSNHRGRSSECDFNACRPQLGLPRQRRCS